MKRHIVRVVGTDLYPIDVLELSDIPAVTPPTPGVIPPGTTFLLQFSGQNGANAKRYMNADGNASNIDANTGELRIPMPFAGKLSNLIVQLGAGLPNQPPPARAEFIVRKNGVGNDPIYDTALQVIFDQADIGSVLKKDLTHEVDVVVGDMIGIAYYPISMGGAMSSAAWARFLLVTT